MATVDFLTIPWETWTTDAHRKAMEFAVELSDTHEWGILPTFGFTLKTDNADEFALRMYRIYLDRCCFRLNRGPLGGGTYIFQEGLWGSTCGMIPSQNCSRAGASRGRAIGYRGPAVKLFRTA